MAADLSHTHTHTHTHTLLLPHYLPSLKHTLHMHTGHINTATQLPSVFLLSPSHTHYRERTRRDTQNILSLLC